MSTSDIRGALRDARPEQLHVAPKALGEALIYGVDVSHRQKAIRWETAVATGVVNFAWIKATEGATWTDPFAAEHAKQLTDLGVPFGYYHFARPELDDEQDEADHFANVLAKLPKPQLRPWLDIEVRGTSLDLPGWCATWSYKVERAGCGDPIYYTYFNFVGALRSSGQLNFDLALADYRDYSLGLETVFPSGVKRVLVHQYTGKGHIAGLLTDIDRCVTTASRLEACRLVPVQKKPDYSAEIAALEAAVAALKVRLT